MIPRSRRIDNKKIELSIISEDIFRYLFGHRYNHIHGLKNDKRWRELLKKLLGTIELSIEKNVLTDSLHKKKIYKYLNIAKKSCLSNANEDIEIIMCLIAIIFELIGGLPDYRQSRSVKRKYNYYLNRFRIVHYTQSFSQKVNVVFEAAKYSPFKEELCEIDLYEILYEQCMGDTKKFIDWFKNEFPILYSKLF